MKRTFTSTLFLAIGASLSLAASAASAGTLNLADQNSTVAITPTSSAGLTNWTINGQNIATQQWFYYAIGGGSQASIDTLGLTSSGTFSFGSGTRGGYAVYSGSNGLGVEVDYMLTGGSSNMQSDLSETIRLTNTSTASQTYHFFQYSNFNLSGGSADTVQFPNANTVNQVGGNLPLQTVVAPTPNEHEGALFPTTLTHLTSGPYTLNNTPAIGGPAVGPGDATWAYEWDPIIAAGASFIISDDQHIDPGTPVPEPATTILFAAAGIALMGVRLRRRWMR
jgi:hypothetical protein